MDCNRYCDEDREIGEISCMQVVRSNELITLKAGFIANAADPGLRFGCRAKRIGLKKKKKKDR